MSRFSATNLFKRALSPSLRNISSIPRTFPTSGFKVVPDSERLEEEKWKWYTPQSFYPVRIGDVLQSKYQVLYKLDYGTTSTIWVCRDLSRNEYVCMKSMVSDYSSVEREIHAYEALSAAAKSSDAPGKKYVRHALDQFEIAHAGRSYNFLIHEPLGMPVKFLQGVLDGKIPFVFCHEVIFRMLQALEYLHKDANLIHGDIQKSNILLRIEDLSVLQAMEESQFTSPSARKLTSETAVFQSCAMEGRLVQWFGEKSTPVLCDFGEARSGHSSHTDLIQPSVYRAPEVFLHLPWNKPVDIWNLGCMAWSLLFGRSLFSSTVKNNSKSAADVDHLAQMVALIGPPPPELLAEAGPRALEFFNHDGSAKGRISGYTFESLLEGNLERLGKSMREEEKEALLFFMRRTLTWRAEERATATGLLTAFQF
ncbi:hypothetical protein M413DRAFT_77652 [Hebeloma cylindrosporum]|uniref:Protein kinase domain-containing protein n=1 Tax=Hebeloma cylindrosporum TaxID=76867 RepID=A0A0C3BJH0_HEBCY|nr:hypothetical protein M413DRAFT_77652 [Hebeloma cylindrosporum h7]